MGKYDTVEDIVDDEVEDIVNLIARLYDPYVEEAKKIIYKHVKWFNLGKKNIGVLGLFYIEDVDRFDRSRKIKRKIYLCKELSLLDFNLEFYISGYYDRSYITTIKKARIAWFPKVF